jgi:hypothetical protein
LLHALTCSSFVCHGTAHFLQAVLQQQKPHRNWQVTQHTTTTTVTATTRAIM